MNSPFKVVTLGAGKKAPEGLADDLRKLADAIERNEVTQVIAAYVQNDEYVFIYGTSDEHAVTLSTLMQWRCLRRMEQ